MRRDNFTYLLVALLIFVIVLPVANDQGLISRPVSLLLAVISLLAIGIWSLRGTGRLFVASMCLVVAGIAASVASFARGEEIYYLLSQTSLLLFLGFATYIDLRQIGAGNDISANRIIGAICVYLMLGVIWSIAYSIVEFAQPGSFAGLAEAAQTAWEHDWVYFSFVTITTLGYGDVLPVSTTARSMALAEAVVGQFYIAVLVAGLVSAYISARPSQSNQG